MGSKSLRGIAALLAVNAASAASDMEWGAQVGALVMAGYVLEQAGLVAPCSNHIVKRHDHRLDIEEAARRVPPHLVKSVRSLAAGPDLPDFKREFDTELAPMFDALGRRAALPSGMACGFRLGAAVAGYANAKRSWQSFIQRNR